MHSPDVPVRLCVLGDSHIVALRRALSRRPAGFESLDIKLIAAARDGMRQTRFNGTRLEACNEKVAGQFMRTSGGDPFVDLARFDALAVCGLGLSLQSLFWIFNTHLPAWAQAGAQAQHLISPAAVRAASEDILRGSIAAWLMGEIRKTSSLPLFVIPQPSPEALITKLSTRWPWLAQPSSEKLLQLLLDSVNEAVPHLCAEHNAAPLLQPAHTIAPTGFTLKAFHQVGAEGDAAHMNADYGLLVLEQLRQAISAQRTLGA